MHVPPTHGNRSLQVSITGNGWKNPSTTAPGAGQTGLPQRKAVLTDPGLPRRWIFMDSDHERLARVGSWYKSYSIYERTLQHAVVWAVEGWFRYIARRRRVQRIRCGQARSSKCLVKERSTKC